MDRMRGREWPVVWRQSSTAGGGPQSSCRGGPEPRRDRRSQGHSRPSTICVMRPLGTAPTWVASTLPPLNTIMVGTPRTL
jgi:hypothetical protein